MRTSPETILVKANGEWWADGREITHLPTLRLFQRSLKKDKNGYFLQIGKETKPIEVEDTAYFVEAIHGSPLEGFTLQLSDQTQELLNPTQLSFRPNRLIYRTQSGENAKFLRRPYLDLLNYLEEENSTYFLLIEGQKIIL